MTQSEKIKIIADRCGVEVIQHPAHPHMDRLFKRTKMANLIEFNPFTNPSNLRDYPH